MTAMMSSMATILPRYAPLLLLAMTWETASRTGLVPISALPPLDTVATAWYDLAVGGDLWTNGVASMTCAVFVAWAVAMMLCIGIKAARTRRYIYRPL